MKLFISRTQAEDLAEVLAKDEEEVEQSLHATVEALAGKSRVMLEEFKAQNKRMAAQIDCLRESVKVQLLYAKFCLFFLLFLFLSFPFFILFSSVQRRAAFIKVARRVCCLFVFSFFSSVAVAVTCVPFFYGFDLLPTLIVRFHWER